MCPQLPRSLLVRSGAPFSKVWRTGSSAIAQSVSLLSLLEEQVPLPVFGRHTSAWDRNADGHGDFLPPRAGQQFGWQLPFLSLFLFCPIQRQNSGASWSSSDIYPCLAQRPSCSSCSKTALLTEMHLGQSGNEAAGNQQEHRQAVHA